MRRCYARASAAENPLRPEAPKSPWSRRIPFSAPSGHFRIVLFLIGLIGCLCSFSSACRSVYWFFFRSLFGFRFLWFRSSVFIGGLCVPSVFSYPLRSDGSLVASVSVLLFSVRVPFSDGGFCVPWFSFFVRIGVPMRFVSRGCVSVPLVAFVFRRRFFHWGFMSFVRLQVSFIDPSVPFSWLCFSSSFPVLHSSSFSSSRPFPSLRLRSGRFVFVLRFRLSASPRRNAPSGGGVSPIGQGCPRARGRRPRGWRGGVGPGSRTRAAMGVWGRRRRGGRRPMGSAGRRTRRSR